MKLHFSKMKELQDILYSDPIDQEKLTKQIEILRTTCSKEEIDHELFLLFSLLDGDIDIVRLLLILALLFVVELLLEFEFCLL